MDRLPTVIFRSPARCMLFFPGSLLELSPDVPALTPAPASGEMAFTVWSMEVGRVSIPALHRLRFENGLVKDCTLKLIDWGDALEAFIEPLPIMRAPDNAPRLLDSCGFAYKDSRAGAELYLDGGLRIAFAPERGEAFSVPLGEGTGGSLRTVDLGREVMLAVLGETERGMRLIMLDRNAETLLDEEGSFADISDGSPTIVRSLPSARGLEKRIRFELSPRGFVKSGEETGFFTHPERPPDTDADRALCFFEELALGFERGWRGLLSGGLSGTGEEELRGFLGSWSKAAVYPMEEPEGTVTAGLYEDGDTIIRPRRFRLVFEDGAISDLFEL